MERYARFVVRHRVAVLLTVGLVTALLASQLRHLHLEIRRRAQLPASHPNVRIQNEIADIFGGETTVIVGILPREGDIFTLETLETIVRITRGLEDTPGVVTSNLLSLASSRAKNIQATDGGMDLRPFLEDMPQSDEELAELRRIVLADPLYSRVLVSEDGRAASIIADFDDNVSDVKIRLALESLISSERSERVEIAIGGAPLVRASMAEYTRQMAYLFALALLVIGLVHYEAFRTIQAMLLPLLTSLLSVVWAMGLLGLSGEPIDTWSALTPVVILAVAAGHAVQILKRYYEEFARGYSTEEAVVRSLVAVGPVTLTAGLIASAGFASLATFGVASVRTFGASLAVGILSAMLIEISFIPAFRVLLPAPRASEVRRERGGRLLARALGWLGEQTTARPWGVLGVAALALIVGMGGALKVRVDNSFHAWFPASSQLRVHDKLLNERLAGTSTLYILLDGDEEGDLERPDVLRATGDLQAWLDEQPGVGTSLSLYDFVRRIHAVMAPYDQAAIPDSRALIAQYLFLYSLSGPEDLNSFVDAQHRVGVVRAYAKSDEAEYGGRLLADLRRYAVRRFRSLPVNPRVAGGALGVQTAMNEVVVREKTINMMQIAAIIYLLSSIALRSPLAGLLVVSPLAVSVSLNLGVMGYTGTWLSAGTATVTAMAISIGADFAIYLLFRVREEVRRGAMLPEAIQESLRTAGQAVCFVASGVVLGYLLLIFSGFKLWVQLGLLTALMMLVGALAALTVVPALVLVVRPRFLWR